LRDAAIASPIGPKRALISTAAATAASAPPPSPKTAATANWADPEKAITEKTIGAMMPQPRERASTPKEMPTTKTARAKGIAARAPARYDPELVSCSSPPDRRSSHPPGLLVMLSFLPDRYFLA
jgi:hypothetical protein